MIFTASIKSSRIILLLIVPLLATIPIISYIYRYKEWWGFLVFLLFPLALIRSWAYRVKSYEIRNHQIIVCRSLTPKIFNIQEIEKIERVPKRHIDMSLWGYSSSSFSYCGNYYNINYGKIKLYATNLNNAVMLTMKDGKKMVLSPDEPEKFIDAALEKLIS
jgi:hypothetical protein